MRMMNPLCNKAPQFAPLLNFFLAKKFRKDQNLLKEVFLNVFSKFANKIRLEAKTTMSVAKKNKNIRTRKRRYTGIKLVFITDVMDFPIADETDTD